MIENKSVLSLINKKLEYIVKDISKETTINISDILNFVHNKYKFIKINNIYENKTDLIKDKLLDYLNNDPKFLSFINLS